MAAEIESKSLGDLLEDIAQDPDEGRLLHALVLTYEFDQEQLINVLLRQDLSDSTTLTAHGRLSLSRMHPLVVYDAAKTRDFSSLPPLLEIHPWKSRAFGCHHSKAYCLITERSTHLFLGSFNLTFSGLFRNREVMEHIVRQEGGDREEGLLLREWTDFLRRCYGMRLHASETSALNAILQCLEHRLPEGEKYVRRSGRHLLFSGYGESGLSQLLTIWKAWFGEISPDTLRVVSPFFDADPAENCMAAALRKHFPDLRTMHVCTDEGGFSRLSRAHSGGMEIHVRVIAAAPETERADIKKRAEAMGMSVPDNYAPERRLHAKILLLSRGGRCLCYRGSANFTKNAWLGRNQELGLVSREEDPVTLWRNITRGLYAGREDKAGFLPGLPPPLPTEDPEEEVTKEAFPDFITFISLEPCTEEKNAFFHLHIAPEHSDDWPELLRAYGVRWGEKGPVLHFDSHGRSAPLPEEEWQKLLIGGRMLEFLHTPSNTSFLYPFVYADAFLEYKEALFGLSSTEWLLLHLSGGESGDDTQGACLSEQDTEETPSRFSSVNREENVIIAMQNYLRLFGRMELLFQKRLEESARGERYLARIRGNVVEPLREFAGLLRRERGQDELSRLFKLGELSLFVQRLLRSPATGFSSEASGARLKNLFAPLVDDLEKALVPDIPEPIPETLKSYLTFLKENIHARDTRS